MCGLLGVSGPGINGKDLDIFRDLGIVSMLRGKEGSGIFQTRTNTTQKIRERVEDWTKTPENFANLLEELDDTNGNVIANTTAVDVLMGHCRWPTRGKKTADNAHPFVYRSIVGMHNGTLKDHKYQDAEKTDSEMMFTDMANRGILPVLKDLLPASAYAVTIYDRKAEVLYFARNNHRTLSFAILEDRNVFYWASEALSLRYVLGRRGEKYQIYNLPEHQVFEITPSKINCKDHKKGVRMIHDFAAKPKVEEPKKEEPKVEVVEVKKEEGKQITQVNFLQRPRPGIAHGGHPRVQAQTKVVTTTPNKSVQKQSLKSFYTQCFCGTRHMNLIDSFFMKRGDKGYPVFNEQEGKFYCDDCLNNLEIAKNA